VKYFQIHVYINCFQYFGPKQSPSNLAHLYFRHSAFPTKTEMINTVTFPTSAKFLMLNRSWTMDTYLYTTGKGTWKKLTAASYKKTTNFKQATVSRLAGTHRGNLCLISCSHHLKWVCSIIVFNFMHFFSAIHWFCHNMVVVEMAWEERTGEKKTLVASVFSWQFQLRRL
jgi:hypothetical protein